jgi:hypothetical protein
LTNEMFDDLVDQQIAACREMLTAKGIDYTDGNDRLYNFKVVGSMVGAAPELVWAIYWLKHVFAIAAFCGRERLESEPIEGRITDALNYLYLLRALVEERRTATNQQAPATDTTARMLQAAGVELASG